MPLAQKKSRVFQLCDYFIPHTPLDKSLNSLEQHHNMSAGSLDGRPKPLSLPIEIYNHWLPPVLHQKQVTLLGAPETGRAPRFLQPVG
jgi:hypothetical protein